jgi:glutamyl-tRNA reductase
MPWADLVHGLGWADVVFTATGAVEPVIRMEDVGAALPLRQGRPLWFVDLALPRDVDEAVVQLPGVQRVDIDDLQSFVDAHLAERQAAAPRAEAIVGEEVDRFVTWLNGRDVGPIIAGLRFRAEALAESELAQALKRLDDLDPHSQRVVTLLAHRIVGRLLHEPITRLKTQAARGNGSAYAEAVRELFALDPAQAPSDVVTGHV